MPSLKAWKNCLWTNLAPLTDLDPVTGSVTNHAIAIGDLAEVLAIEGVAEWAGSRLHAVTII